MGLTWLVPAFLAGLAAVVIPILVHLRQRERREPVRFPSLMFLKRIPHKSVQRRRITHPLLLLLRALAVTALVAAFARPFWRQRDERPAAGASRRAVILLVDRSMSMGYRGVWDRVRDSAGALLGGLGPGDQVALVGFDETADVLSPLDPNPAPARARLAALAPNGRSTRFAPALRLAREIAAQARGLKVEIVVISDLQRQALAGLETVERVPGAELRFVPVGDPNPANARVVEVEVDRRVEGKRTRLAVSGQVAAKGEAGRDVKAALIVNGRPLATTTVRLGANATASARFEPVYLAEGDAVAAVALEPDALPADDTLRFSLASANGVPVELLLPPGSRPDESLYLEQALSISRSPALAVTTRQATSVPTADLDRARVVVVLDAGALAGSSLAALEQFVRRGGGLLLLAGSRNVASTPAWWPARVGKIVDRTSERGGRLGQMDADHAAFEPFKDALASDFGAARFFRYRDLLVDSTAQVLARFDDGKPALVEGRLGAGRVLVIGTAPNALWGDFPLQPVFLPLIHRLVEYAGRLQNEKRWYQVGEVVTLPDIRGSLTVKGPDGPAVRLPADSGGRTVALTGLGLYQVQSDLAAAPVARFLVNPAPGASDLARADPKEIFAQLRNPTDSTAAPNVAPLTAVEQERTQSWWIVLVAIALALLAAETIYASLVQRHAGTMGGAT